ncbi:MAG: hypothetical protein CFE26_19260 [Verrucomicrobiales bacterium VVV1]|nr:MAG: hypothetical protein CFE26_19260 [Verrucomicrobiales bacterium VVV1]
MNLSSLTLTLMRQSAGAALAVAAMSGEARAELPGSDIPGVQASSMPVKFETGSRVSNKNDPKKSGEEETKKEEKREPCPDCGRG